MHPFLGPKNRSTAECNQLNNFIFVFITNMLMTI